tara:strand:- start:11957 stop:12982 length:1026 start_codon:yes stop_codon:yes gene_type:complete
MKKLSEHKTEIIAEIGQAHDGSLGILHSYIDALTEINVDTIKFQMHIADSESSKFENFRVKFSYEDKTRFDYWKRMELSDNQWKEIKDHCETNGVNFLCSPFSIEAIDILQDMNVDRFKIGSGEISNYLMLDKISEFAEEIIISTGMSSYDEIDKCFNRYKDNQKKLTLMQCTSDYPVSLENTGIQEIGIMKEKYNCKVGLSDHSGSIYPSLAAVMCGANLVECHAVFNKKMFGPDTSSSLDLDDFKELVKGIRQIEKLKYSEFKKNEYAEAKIKQKELFGKSLSARIDLKKGDLIEIRSLEAKKPYGKGHPPNKYEEFLDRRLKKDIKKGEFLNLDDIEE